MEKNPGKEYMLRAPGNDAHQILTGIFVGNMVAAKDEKFLRANNIKRIVNCTPDVPFYYPEIIQYVRLPLNDRADAENNAMLEHLLPAVLEFMAAPQPSDVDAVLVHCHMGVSRSCSVTAAYLRAFYYECLCKAFAHVRKYRPSAFFFGRSYNFHDALTNFFGR